MIDFVFQKHPLDPDERFSQDRVTKAQFTDIIGAWSWPERLNGHLIIFGLSRQTSIPKKENRVILCMQEWSVADIASIVNLIGPASLYFKVQEWIADITDPAAFEAFAIEQERLPANLRRHWPVEPPFARDTRKRFTRYAHVIRDQLPKAGESADKARLHFGACETARISARQISVEKNTTIEDYPVVAALGFGVSYLRSFRGGRDNEA